MLVGCQVAMGQNYFLTQQNDFSNRILKFDQYDSFMFRSSIDRSLFPSLFQDSKFQYQLTDISFFNSFNSTVPRGSQDGILWQGNGFNSGVSFGVKGQYGLLHFQLKPVVTFSQNKQFDLGYLPVSGTQEYAYRVRPNIDYVQRFGDSAFLNFDLGDSYIDFRYRSMTLGLSNERYWVGPATTNPLLYTYNSGGYPHLFWGTSKPVNIYIGTLEFRHYFGVLKRSDYFDFTRNTEYSTSLINSFNLVYQPKFIPGLYLSFNRIYHEYNPTSFSEAFENISKMFDPFYRAALISDDKPTGWDPDNQVASVGARYILPNDQFELYLEFGRGDHSQDFYDFTLQPDHNRAYVLGVLKSFNVGETSIFSVNYEITKSENTRNTMTRFIPTEDLEYLITNFLDSWFMHGTLQTGLSQNGQLLGASYGPGGNAQVLNFQWLNPTSQFGFKLGRTIYNNALVDNRTPGRNYYDIIAALNEPGTPRWKMRYTELILGAHYSKQYQNGYSVSVGYNHSFIYNYQYIDGFDKSNAHIFVSLNKSFGKGN
jgi:hypothetical protein